MKKLSEELRELVTETNISQREAIGEPLKFAFGCRAAAFEMAARMAENHEAATGWRPVTEAPLDAWVTAGKYTASGEWVTLSCIRPSYTPTPRMGLTHFILHPPPPEREP